MKNYKIIDMPIKYGCFVNGADEAFLYTKDLYENIFGNNISHINKDNLITDVHFADDKLKYLEAVLEMNKRLYNEKLLALQNNEFPLMVGGDHSSAIGSMFAALEFTKGDLSVIWVDAHLDIHTQDTTPSGNIHGMPLAICLHRCDERFNKYNYYLKPENLYYIGTRCYENEEISYVQKANITNLSDTKVNSNNLDYIVQNIINKIKTKYVHISFDLDVLEDDAFPAVNVNIEKSYVSGKGVSINKTKEIIGLLLKKLNVCSMDIVEYNHLLDKDGKCKQIIKDFLIEIKDNNIN